MNYVSVPYISLEQCSRGKIYKLHSRNLSHGVFDGQRGFIGIRTKFNSRFLATEYHWDHPPFATARPLEDTGVVVPDTIRLVESLGTIDSRTNRAVDFDRPVSEGGRGWYYTDTGEADNSIRPVSVFNKELFDILDSFK